MQIIDVTKSAIALTRHQNGARAFTIFGYLILLFNLSIAYELKLWAAISSVAFGVVFILGARSMKRGNRLFPLLCGVFYFYIAWWLIKIWMSDERLTRMEQLFIFAITGLVSFFIVQGIRTAFSSVTIPKAKHIQFRPFFSKRLTNPRRLLIAAVLASLAAVFFTAGLLLSARYDHNVYTFLPYFFEFSDQSSRFIRFLSTIASLSLIAASFFLYKSAKRHLSLSAREVRAADKRPPILILRSFKDDPTEAQQFRLRYIGRPMGSRQSFEEVLTEHLWDYGPVIAIGRPGESVPPLGAAREYITNEDWQTRIQELSASAQMIFLILGKTVGLLTEIQLMTRARLLSRVVFVFPPQQNDLMSLWFLANGAIMSEAYGNPISETFKGTDFLHKKPKDMEDVELPGPTTLFLKALPLFPLLILPRKPEAVCIVGKRLLSNYYRIAIDAAANLVPDKHSPAATNLKI